MKKILMFAGVLTLLLVAIPALGAVADGAGPWADTHSDVVLGLRKDGGPIAVDRIDPDEALGVAETTGTPYDAVTPGTFLSLGFGGTATFGFDNTIENGGGDDLMVYEVTGGNNYPDEEVKIEASHNGTDWVTLADAAIRDEAVDLGILECAKYVRLTDVSNPDSFNNSADGYDVDGLEALNSSEEVCDLGASIDVVKEASSYEVAPGETVDYTYTVTNDGDFDLDNIQISDDFCSPVEYVSGDDGDDDIMGVGEVWIFECSMELEENTENTVDVSGDDPWDNEVTDEDTVEVTVSAPGCTLTQGYWKTHSPDGPAQPADDTWDDLWEEEFDDSDFDWIEVLWTSPKKGDAWFILAHQYIAAYLNTLAGADDTDVSDEMDDAWDILMDHDPDGDLKAGKNADPDRAVALDLAGTLGAFNEGEIGPGHCGDEEPEI